MRSSRSVSGSVTLRNVCAWKTSSASGLIVSLELVDGDDDVVGRHAAGMRVDRVILEPLHRGALEDLHAVLDEQVLEALQAQQRIDAVGAAVTDAGRVPLRAEDLLQLRSHRRFAGR